MLSQAISCRHCGSSNLKANGHAPSGRQRYCCRDCQRSGTADAVGRAYPESFRAQVLAAYQERCSMRGVRGVPRVRHLAHHADRLAQKKSVTYQSLLQRLPLLAKATVWRSTSSGHLCSGARTSGGFGWLNAAERARLSPTQSVTARRRAASFCGSGFPLITSKAYSTPIFGMLTKSCCLLSSTACRHRKRRWTNVSHRALQ